MHVTRDDIDFLAIFELFSLTMVFRHGEISEDQLVLRAGDPGLAIEVNLRLR